MKTIKTLLLLLTISILSCDNNDDLTTPDPTDPTTTRDGFTHNGNFTETPNAYFEIDGDDDNPSDGYPDEYNFFFLDGRMADGDSSPNAPADADEYIFTLNTSNFVFFNLRVEDNPNLATSPPIAGNSYYGDVYDATSNLTPNTIFVENYAGSMQPFSPSYFINGLEYGNPDSNDDTNMQGANNPRPLMVINEMNYDSSNPSASTINVDYVYVNQIGETFTGHYEGTLGVFSD